MAKLDFPVATVDGQEFIADTGVIYTYIGNPPNGHWTGVSMPDSGQSLDSRFVQVIGDAMTGQLTLPGGGNNSQALQKQEIDALISNAEDPLLGNYLRTDAAAGAQVVQSTGQTEFTGGVKVTGGSAADVGPGLYKQSTGGVDFANDSGDRIASFTGAGRVGFPVAVAAAGLYVNNQPGTSANSSYGIWVSPDWDGNTGTRAKGIYTTSYTGTTAINEFAGYQASGTSDVTRFTGADSIQAGFWARNTISSAADTNAGFYSEVGASTTSRPNYGFYAAGSAPNFYAGNTYIGGTTSRNTFDLWKSTLTEEQLETLEAGTLVAPANVSLPGDGSFARQWYYNQQDTETQAALTAGTLEYPEHLAAATFTDTFALGDNTKINLLTSGIVQSSGIEFIGVKISSNIKSRGIVYSNTKKALLSVNRPNTAGENVDIFLARTDNTQYDADGNRTPLNINRATSFKAESPIGNAAGEYGTYDSYVGFHATDPGNTNGDAEWTGNDDSYGFLGGVSTRTGTNGGQTYNFYAKGNAPNYFAGNIDCDGLVNGAFSLRMQTDDPAAFTTTLTTDEEGNEVSNSVYNGTTEDLLSIIKDLRARVTALENA